MHSVYPSFDAVLNHITALSVSAKERGEYKHSTQKERARQQGIAAGLAQAVSIIKRAEIRGEEVTT